VLAMFSIAAGAGLGMALGIALLAVHYAMSYTRAPRLVPRNLKRFPPLASDDGEYTLDPCLDEQLQELLIQARCVWHLRDATSMQMSDGLRDMLAAFLRVFEGATTASDLLPVADSVRTLLSAHNWWRLRGLAKQVSQTPADLLDEQFGWGGVGMFSRETEWIGHGFWWRSSKGGGSALDNTGGFCLNDFDAMEPNFESLPNATVLWADAGAIRREFELDEEMGEEALHAWLLRNCAFLSEGQRLRLQPGNDHSDLLHGQARANARTRTACGVRMRSGGRAAQFFADGRYYIHGEDDGGLVLTSQSLDVKGIGTHVRSAETRPERSGLLGLGDALLELFWQRLIQRLLDNTPHKSEISTVRCLAIIDTGLAYVGANPATGTVGERCVLEVRQRQSRCLPSYGHPSFSGNMDPSDASLGDGGRRLCATLYQHGLTGEFWPSLVRHVGDCIDSVPDSAVESALSSPECRGNWNLQADATASRFVDFSDFYALPRAPLHPAWRMSESSFVDSFTLVSETYLRHALSDAATRRRLFPASADVETALEAARERRRELSRSPEHGHVASAASSVGEDGVILPGKPDNFMTWFLELNDSEMARWVASKASLSDRAALAELGAEIQAKLDLWLPAARDSHTQGQGSG